MIDFLRKIIPERSPLRLIYHKVSAILAAIVFRFPGHHIEVIAVTGTSGKSTTVELIWSILQNSGRKCGSLSTIQFHIGDEVFDNVSLRTSLRPWNTQKWLRKMVVSKCKYAVIESSSHAIDQDRLWGIGIDTAVLTNISDNEHLDYHGTFTEYKKTKLKLFKLLSREYRKPSIQKTMVLNRDDDQFESFDEISVDRKWTYSHKKSSDFYAQNIQLTNKNIEFSLRVPNDNEKFKIPLVGLHNLENILAAIATVSAQKISLAEIKKSLKKLKGIPSRLESIDMEQEFSVLVDYTYKPSALKSVLSTLKKISKGRVIIVWGGAGGRSKSNWQESGEIMNKLADEIVLTTDDPYQEDPAYIAKCVREKISRKEGESFFEIEDRYEAIRYAILTAKKDDTILIAGRGHEQIQTIGKTKIQFDDREVCREILGLLEKESKKSLKN